MRTYGPMFHVELRQFPHVSRTFNLSRAELDARFARPWVAGLEFQHEDRDWQPEKAKLTIYEGPELAVSGMGLGRGWATVGKTSKEVTETILAETQRGVEGSATLDLFKASVRGAARRPLPLTELVELAAAEFPRSRASEQLALAEQAVWELLHQGRVELCRADGPVPREDWAEVVMSWATWTRETGLTLTVAEAPG
jgi:hypothetical protein